jgi:hypothetical protein
MTNPLASLGLTLTNMKSFGFTAQSAISAFGEQAVKTFVAESLNVTAAQVANIDATDLFSFAQRVDTFNASQGNASNTAGDLSAVNNLLLSRTGSGLDDLNFSISPDGTVTGSLEGVAGATNSVNIFDLMDQSLANM